MINEVLLESLLNFVDGQVVGLLLVIEVCHRLISQFKSFQTRLRGALSTLLGRLARLIACHGAEVERRVQRQVVVVLCGGVQTG